MPNPPGSSAPAAGSSSHSCSLDPEHQIPATGAAQLLSQCQSEAAEPCPRLPRLPPREERLPALEALRVGLAGGALVGTRRFHDHGWHLHQVQGALPVLQRLSQVQDLHSTTERSLSCPTREQSWCSSTPRQTDRVRLWSLTDLPYLASHDSNLLVKLPPVKARVLLQEKEPRTR